MRSLRLAVRLGHAVLVDASRALLSAARVPDFERVLASYLVSTLVRLCDLDPASSATGAAHRDDERRTDADTAAAASPPKERCAVCFSGWMGVSVPEGGAILRRQLLDPLHADSLLALTYNADDQCIAG